MSQKKPDCQPSALLMLSSEEMSSTLLGGLNDSNIPTLLALPHELPNPSSDSASHLFLAEDGDVDNFLGQTTPTLGSHQTFPLQKTSTTTIPSFISNPFSNPPSGMSYAPSPPNSVINQAHSSTISRPLINNTTTAPPPPSKGDVSGNNYQYRMAGKYQHIPPLGYYQPPTQQPSFGPPSMSSFQNLHTPHGPQPQSAPYMQPDRAQPPLLGSSVQPGLPVVGGFYKPIECHWFYTKKVEEKLTWLPFSRLDSSKLEEAFNDEEKVAHLTPVEGGRFDVDIPARRRKSVYWKEAEEEEEGGGGGGTSEVRRCSWFYRPDGDANFVPYDEKIAAGLEESYKHAIQTADFHKRLAFPTGETIIIHGPNSIVHYPPSSQPDAWGNAMGDLRPQVVRRGIIEFENIPKDDGDKVDHLVLIVLGFNHDIKRVVRLVDEFRQVSEQMLVGHFSRPMAEGRVGRVEFLPVVWSHEGHLFDDIADVDRTIKTLTLASIGKLRRFTNETLVELMFYASPSHAQKAVTHLTRGLNATYETFRSRNSGFSGGVSIVGHGVGSVVVYDILANQGEDFPDPKLAQHSPPPNPPAAEPHASADPPHAMQSGLKRSLNDSSSSLASLAESDRISLGLHSSLEEVLERLGLKDFEEKFRSEQIDVASLVLLEESDVKEMGLPLGPRKKLQDFIKKTQAQNVSGFDISKAHQAPVQRLPPQPDVQLLLQQQQQQQQQQSISQQSVDQDVSNGDGRPTRATFTFEVSSPTEKGKSSRRGGIDVLLTSHLTLDFRPENFFALGSPVAMVLALRGSDLLGEEFRLPTCPGYHNIFHPSDPLAYRMEPMVLPHVPQKAVLIPHHKGRKRLHLELKENLARIGFDIKQRIVESFRTTWRTINNFAAGYAARGGGAPSLPEPRVDDEEVDREVSGVLAEMQKEAEDAGSVVASSVADDSDFPVGSLNQGRRVDFVLQEKPLEIFNDYIFALSSSSCYWQSEDAALMLLKEIYLPMGIVAQKPNGHPQPGVPIGPPPKSGFVQSSAIVRGQGPASRASPYVSYSANQQPYWSATNSELHAAGPPAQSNSLGSFPAPSIGPPPTNLIRPIPTNPIGPPQTNPIGPPPTHPIGLPSNQMFRPMHPPSQPFQTGPGQRFPPPPPYGQPGLVLGPPPPAPMASGRPLGPPPTRADFVRLN